jgi:hypothetical protein
MMPLILIFLSQFVLGIGSTLYYALGQPYLDDNVKKTETPMLLGIAANGIVQNLHVYGARGRVVG